MESKLKHLEFIQSAISRMAHNSFLLKGWSVTIAGALFVASLKELNIKYLYVSFLIILFFWILDSYFLSRERLFIKLYNIVRLKKEAQINFCMSTTNLQCCYDWPLAIFSHVMSVFYGGILLAHLLVLNFI